MKWRRYSIPISDLRAKQHILESLNVGGHGHTFPKNLLSKFSTAEGPIFAIAMEGLDVENITGYSFAQPHFGRGLGEMSRSGDIPIDSWPIDGLRTFLFDYLRTTTQGLVVFDDHGAKRSDWWQQSDVRAEYKVESQRAFYNDEVLYFLTPVDNENSIDEDTIRSADTRWNAGVCASDLTRPVSESWPAEFFDELAAKTEHIVMSAFDEEGFLVWSPQK